MDPNFQKREICLFDISDNIGKNDIDIALKKKYEIVTSKVVRKVTVEFKTSKIAQEVKDFFDANNLIYKTKSLAFRLKGNRLFVFNMQDASLKEIKNFFSKYGEVNNVFFHKNYYATLASIGQAIELVEHLKVIRIGDQIIEIKYSNSRNIENSSSKNNKNSVKIEFPKQIEFFEPNIQIGKTTKDDLLKDQAKKMNLNVNLGCNKLDLNSKKSEFQKTRRKKNNRELNGKAEGLVSNPNKQLFATGPDLKNSLNFNSLNKLNYNSPEFKSTNYLEEKEKKENKEKFPQSFVTKTYYPTNQSSNKALLSNSNNYALKKDPLLPIPTQSIPVTKPFTFNLTPKSDSKVKTSTKSKNEDNCIII